MDWRNARRLCAVKWRASWKRCGWLSKSSVVMPGEGRASLTFRFMDSGVPGPSPGMTTEYLALLPSKRLNAGLRAPEDQGVDVVRAFVGVHGFQVHHMADHVEFVADTVAAVHVARHARNIQRLAAGIALDQRDHLRCSLAFVLQAADAQTCLQAAGDFGLHVGQLLLNELVRRQGSAELLAIERVGARLVPAELGRAQGAPGDAVARVVQAAERA